jgi:hypothetical protein
MPRLMSESLLTSGDHQPVELKRVLRGVLVCTGFLVVASLASFAQDNPKAEPINVELQKATDEYTKSKKKAAEALLAAMEQEVNAVKDDAKLDVDDKVKRLDRLNQEKKAFESMERVPTMGTLKASVATYKSELAAAREKCNPVFKEAANKVLRDDLEKAKAILAERDRLFQPGGTDRSQKDPKAAGEMGFGEAKFGQGSEKINSVEVKVGDPQFTLIWDSRADIDLHVIEPGGSEIFWEKRNGAQGGELDVDDVDGFGPENINYVQGKGPLGKYTWYVHYYGGLGGIVQPTRWKVRVKQNGKTTVYQGTLSRIGEKSERLSIQVE